MTDARIETELARLGFAVDWSVTCGGDYWSSVIDPTERRQINGECRGIACRGDTRRELFADMLHQAKDHAPYLDGPCSDQDCEFHNP